MKDSIRKAQEIKNDKEATLTILVGPPRSGKSTYCENVSSEVVVSRDIGVEAVGVGATYSDKWNSLTKDDHKLIDSLVSERFNRLVKEKSDIVIDMTNMSKKSRRKWLSDGRVKKNYKTKAIVFIESPACLLSRNTPQKTISVDVITRMMRNFVYPNYEEFDSIEIFDQGI